MFLVSSAFIAAFTTGPSLVSQWGGIGSPSLFYVHFRFYAERF
jgi:hypothetical protein